MLKSVQGTIAQNVWLNSLPFADLDENETYLEFNVSRISDSNWINKPSFTIQSLLDQMPGQKFESDEFLSNSISSKYYKPSEFLECKLAANNFTVLHINVASLSKHIDELRSLLRVLPKTPFRYHRDNRDKDVR